MVSIPSGFLNNAANPKPPTTSWGTSKPTTKQSEVIRKMILSFSTEILTDGASQEEDHDDRRRDPDGTIEVRVAIEDIQEVSPGV